MQPLKICDATDLFSPVLVMIWHSGMNSDPLAAGPRIVVPTVLE